jgi:hypothetical protein
MGFYTNDLNISLNASGVHNMNLSLLDSFGISNKQICIINTAKNDPFYYQSSPQTLLAVTW